MSVEEAVERGLRLVPNWFPVVVAAVAFLFGAGGTFAVSQLRISTIERRLDATDSRMLEGEKRDEATTNALIEMKTDIRWIRTTLESKTVTPR